MSAEASSTLPKGVYLTSWGNRWFSQIQKDGKRYYLGTFTSPEAAAAARAEAAHQLGITTKQAS